MASSSHRARARLRTTPLAVVTGLVAAVLMALTMSGTMSAFTASITNANNTATTGTLLMRLANAQDTSCYSNGAKGASVSSTSTNSSGDTTAGNSATCTSVSAFSASGLRPSARTAAPTTVTVFNDGTLPASGFTLKGAPCTPGKTDSTAGTASDICSMITVTFSSDKTPAWTGTLKELGEKSSGFTLPSVPAGSSQVFTFTTTLADGLSNDYQGLTATVPLTWTFTA